MFFIEAPAPRENGPDHAFEVTIPTYSSGEYRKGEVVAIIEAGMAAITLGKIVGVKVSDKPSTDADEARGEDGDYLYADGALGDRYTVRLDEHGEVDLLPQQMFAIGNQYEYAQDPEKKYVLRPLT